MRWEPDRGVPASITNDNPHKASAWTALGRGLRCRCPVCGQGRLFRGYLTLAPACEACGTAFGHLRADDAPPYFTIFLVGHLLVPGVFWVEKAYEPPMWVHMALWLPFFTVVSMLLLRPVKGAVVAWMLRLGLTGEDQGGVRPHQPPSETTKMRERGHA